MKELIEPVNHLMNFLKWYSDKNYRKPKMFPTMLREAAEYWIAHQEPPDDYAEAVTLIVENGKQLGYNTPYHDRLLRCLKQFLKLKEIHQVAVIDGIGRGVPYRGDPIHQYLDYVKEAEVMAQNKDQYIEEGFRKMHRALKHMVA